MVKYISDWIRHTCPHGRFRWYRWEGPDEECSEPVYGHNGCKVCLEELLSGD